MRIVYDDAMQDVLVAEVKTFMSRLAIQPLLAEEWCMTRVQPPILRGQLNKALREKGLRIGNNVTHKNGIGNNCQYPVYYTPKDAVETQQCAYININRGMCGEAFISIEDYDGRRVSPLYTILPCGKIEVKD